VLDEVGRGTSASDGLAISYGVVDHLARINKCRTLFATHAHELARLFVPQDRPHASVVARLARLKFTVLVATSRSFAPSSSRLGLLCVDAHLTFSCAQDELACTYTVRPGVNSESSGLRVARLAGLPASAIEAADSVRRTLS